MSKRILFTVSLVLVVVLALAGCSSTPKPEQSAEDVVSSAIDAFKVGDIEKFYSYVNLADEAANEATDADTKKEAELLGPKTTYKIVSSDEDVEKGTAKVKVEITRPDLKAVFAKTQELATAAGVTSGSLTKEEAEAKSIEFFQQALNETTEMKNSEAEVELALIKTDDGTYVWKITNEALYVPLFGDSAEMTAK